MAEMDAAARAAYNEYMRKWRKKNPDKVKATRAKYWERKAAAAAAAVKGSTDNGDT